MMFEFLVDAKEESGSGLVSRANEPFRHPLAHLPPTVRLHLSIEGLWTGFSEYLPPLNVSKKM
jgi:hypothetical protein